MSHRIAELVLGALILCAPTAALAQLRTQVIATGLTNPIAFVVDPVDPLTFYAVEQRGTIRIIRNNAVLPAMFLDNRGYHVPEDNPFLDRQPISALAEIWAFGLRNPWRYNFDDWTHGGTGALVVADVGQVAREEVNWEPVRSGGRNYGWRVREGRAAYDAGTPAAYQPLVEPIHDYPRSDGQSITGGFVYRGAALNPMFNGRYFFADYVAGRVYTLGLALDERQEARAVDLLEITTMLGGTSELGLISSFGVDASAELYLVSYSRGRILKIIPE